MILRSFNSPIFRRLSLAIAAVSALALTACHDKSTPAPVVLAQVDQSKLTLDEMRESFPAEYEKILPREQYLDFIQRWINDEVVYQQALKTKLDQDPKVMRKLDALRRKALIEEFLARESAGQEFEPDDNSMNNYYEMHKDEFRRTAPEFRYSHIRVNSLKEALALHSKIHGDNFAALAAGSSLDSSGDNASPSFLKASEVPACLHDVTGAKPGWVSPPLSCTDGVYLVKLIDRVEAGSLLPFSEAKDAFRVQLVMEQKDKMREAKIRQYKEGVNVSVNLDQIPGQEDSGQGNSSAATNAGKPQDSSIHAP